MSAMNETFVRIIKYLPLLSQKSTFEKFGILLLGVHFWAPEGPTFCMPVWSQGWKLQCLNQDSVIASYLQMININFILWSETEF